MANKPKKYSLWKSEHESIYTVMLYKHKDTNSSTEVDKWLAQDWTHCASFYREEDEINAQYVHCFDAD